jgi:hypothetical protein
MPKYEIEFDGDEVEAACAWHGGQSTMLYAVCSTGALALGSRRPHSDMTDAEWFDDLKDGLESEVEDAIEGAEKQLDKAKSEDDEDELNMQIDAFKSMLRKLQK